MIEINNNMDMKTKEKTEQSVQPTKKPDENSGILVEGYIKIFDPKTKEVFVNGRA